MTTLPRPPCLQYRRGRPHFRLRVPDDLRPFVGKREIVRALQARDGRAIAAEVRRLRAEYNRQFENARGQAPASADTGPEAAPAAAEAEPAKLIEMVCDWFDQLERTALLAPAQIEPDAECR